ncbi:hypothetical protein ACWDRB_43630 [Nonomuraea sp. NPDC003707]
MSETVMRAVQLGRAMGAAVTAVAGARNADLVLDYASIDSYAPERDFDTLIDCPRRLHVPISPDASP